MYTKIVGIAGRKRHGKDTGANYLREGGFTATALADPCKQIVMDLYGLTWDQVYGSDAEKEAVDLRWGLSPRRIMQLMGTGVGRLIHPETWIRKCLENIRAGQEGHPHVVRDDVRRCFRTRNTPTTAWVISDIRFPNEAAHVRAAGGVVIKVVRPGMPDTDTDESETSVDLVEADHIIDNDGSLEDLRKKFYQLQTLWVQELRDAHASSLR